MTIRCQFPDCREEILCLAYGYRFRSDGAPQHPADEHYCSRHCPDHESSKACCAAEQEQQHKPEEKDQTSCL